MVHDHLWAEAGMKPRRISGMLCVGCLEIRLGRELNSNDFIDAPINRGAVGQSERMLSRIRRTAHPDKMGT